MSLPLLNITAVWGCDFEHQVLEWNSGLTGKCSYIVQPCLYHIPSLSMLLINPELIPSSIQSHHRGGPCYESSEYRTTGKTSHKFSGCDREGHHSQWELGLGWSPNVTRGCLVFHPTAIILPVKILTLIVTA